MVLVTNAGYGAMAVEGCQLMGIGISDGTIYHDVERTDWNVTQAAAGRLAATGEVIME